MPINQSAHFDITVVQPSFDEQVLIMPALLRVFVVSLFGVTSMYSSSSERFERAHASRARLREKEGGEGNVAHSSALRIMPCPSRRLRLGKRNVSKVTSLARVMLFGR